MQKPFLYFVSDGTGIASETLGLTLSSQFPMLIDAPCETLPFVRDMDSAKLALAHIKSQQLLSQPFIFITLAAPELRLFFTQQLSDMQCAYMDFFGQLLPQISQQIHQNPLPTIGARHAEKRDTRIEAIDYALSFDDGVKLDYEQADILLLGLSRSGKTPTALWLALHYGLKAANYPITDDDFERGKLPEAVMKARAISVLLIQNPQRLAQIRQERYQNSNYASLAQCTREIEQLKQMKALNLVPRVDVSNKSVEEIAAQALALTNIHPKGRF